MDGEWEQLRGGAGRREALELAGFAHRTIRGKVAGGGVGDKVRNEEDGTWERKRQHVEEEVWARK